MENYTCDVCEKKFAREDNLREHEKKHQQHQCTQCPNAFGTAENLEHHRHHRHNQLGGGRKRTAESPQPGPVIKQRITESDDPKEHYSIVPIGEQKMKKFNTTANRYKINFKELEIRSLPNILKSLHQIFTSILRELTKFMDDTDLVRLTVQCPELDYPISLPFMRLSHLTADRLLAEIERVLQSYEEFVIDQALEIELVHVRLPSGGGRKRKCYVNLERTMVDKRCFIKIKNDDDLCCARAIVTAKAKIEEHPKWDSIRLGRGIQKTLAEELHKAAGVPLKKCDLEDVKAFQTILPDYQIHVLSKEAFNAIVYKGPETERKIFLYLHDGHYDVISTITGFLGRSYFCTKCSRGYDHKEKHACNNPCHLCHKCHDDQSEDWKHCQACNRYFKNAICFELHTKISSLGNSTCNTYYRCERCSATVNKTRSNKEHVCGNKYCNTCKTFEAQDHCCYMKTVAEEEGAKLRKRKRKEDDDDELKKWIFFDFECTQDEMIQCDVGHEPRTRIICGHCHRKNCHINPCKQGYMPKQVTSCKNCNKLSCGTYRHVPNLCVVHKACEECVDEEHIDEHSFCPICQEKQLVFAGKNTRDQFCKWLFSEENEGAKVFCHNFKGYDSYPIVNYLYENAILPEVIMNGSKFMSIDIPHLKMRFLDSMNFIPMALSKIPKTLELTELTKGYFPHMFNRRENQDVVLNHLPDVKYYNPDGMMPDTRNKFMQWYEDHMNDSFDFQEELLKYCISDVDILRRGCLKFRDIFRHITSTTDKEGIDPFDRCITIASACNLVFRMLFLNEESIGIIPPQGYRPQDNQSVKALQWMKYIAHQQGLDIQHAGNIGEKVIGPYKVDGYYEKNGQNVVMEFHGDFWHGNPKCYSAATINKVVGVAMGDLYQKTVKKRTFIKSQGYTYIEMWESEFDKQIKNDENMKQFVENLDIVSPLRPRDSFHGGRTEAFNLHAEATGDVKIKYYDVTSLYPYINKTGKIPLGHPKITTDNFDNIRNYEGLVKCRMLPPRNLHIPVLPAKVNGKLMFGLCRTCMSERQNAPCQHSDRERMLTGTWVSDEVKKAIEKGYLLDRIYEVLHFERISQYDPTTKTGGAFTDYVNTFLKLKQEASGWPKWCQNEDDKKRYIWDYYIKEGIRLEYDNIKENLGLRALAKLMLNSFWGKFGQRENMPRTTYVTDPAVYFDMLTSDHQEIKDVSYVSDEMVRMQWVMDEDFVETSGRTNCVVASYTTAQARLLLYSYLEQLGTRALYADTDSVIFTSKPGDWEPPLGDYLGDMTDEVSGKEITSFVTGGPKNYAYVIRDQDGKTSTQCKVKGITLNYKNGLEINFDTIRQMIKSDCTARVTISNDYKIARESKTMDIITRTEEKEYKIVFDKRVLKKDLSSVPYGM